ncbi:hypothetical protein F2P56_017634 [Juglans regia]|uniref:Uncharacterized protein LOC108988730 n=2 Tax=Juglans regia TaxID=51240 RepID=A0A2I4EDY8_JUGRE|nr:uncharacterized protein LOC108988730 [Juglans regia]KAF5461547.1 hypothetical protein F2P56_017634 [Juglans regia]
MIMTTRMIYFYFLPDQTRTNFQFRKAYQFAQFLVIYFSGHGTEAVSVMVIVIEPCNGTDWMDKNMTRIDLLSAGRKKLQQFHQKKESKISTGHRKSSRKYGEAEQHEPDAGASSTTISKASYQVT